MKRRRLCCWSSRDTGSWRKIFDAGEIDLIAMDQEYLCFVEVKFRENSDCGGPFLAVDNRKQRRICQTALFYLMKRGMSEETPCRFDVVGITPDDTALIKDAFSYHT